MLDATAGAEAGGGFPPDEVEEKENLNGVINVVRLRQNDLLLHRDYNPVTSNVVVAPWLDRIRRVFCVHGGRPYTWECAPSHHHEEVRLLGGLMTDLGLTNTIALTLNSAGTRYHIQPRTKCTSESRPMVRTCRRRVHPNANFVR